MPDGGKANLDYFFFTRVGDGKLQNCGAGKEMRFPAGRPVRVAACRCAAIAQDTPSEQRGNEEAREAQV